MNASALPRVGDIMFLERCEVMVTKVLTCFHIVEICRPKVDLKFCVDADALTFEPDFSHSISLRYFGGVSDE